MASSVWRLAARLRNRFATLADARSSRIPTAPKSTIRLRRTSFTVLPSSYVLQGSALEPPFVEILRGDA